jgi:hypothetical protein
MTPTPPQLCSAHRPSLLLGLFIIGQLGFLAAANVLDMVTGAQPGIPEAIKPAVEKVAPGWTKKTGHFWELTQMTSSLTRFWGQVTGQPQSWSLFAPLVAGESTFPALRLIYEEDPRTAPAISRTVSLLAAGDGVQAMALAALLHPETKPPGPILQHSDNEPRDLDGYFRLGLFRLRRLENNLVLPLLKREDEAPEETRRRWKGEIEKYVRENGDLLHAYMEWRSRSLQRRHSDLGPPCQVILLMRVVRTRPPEDSPPFWEEPMEYPVARWLPQVRWPADYWPIEMFDPETQRFESVPK